MTDTTDPQARRARYAAAIREAEGWVLDGGQHMLDAVMAVADAEQAELRREHAARLEHLEGALSRIRDRAEVAQVRVRRVVAGTPFAANVERAFAGEQLAAVPVPASAPTDWIDGHPQLEAIAAAVWARCEHHDSGLVIDDPRNIAVAALAAVLPAPVDRAVILREAADWFDRYDVDSARELRRLADAVPVSGPGGATDETQADPAAEELTAEEARALVDQMGLDLYRAQDAIEFARECCDIADREQRPVTTVDVREWLKGDRCTRQRAADEQPDAVSQPAVAPSVEHCIHDRTVHRTHHKQAPVTGCPWCTTATSTEAEAEQQFGVPGCTCRPWTRKNGEARYLDQPGDTVDQISGWERGTDCPHHQPAEDPTP
jgi:hypothetical protein